MFWPVLGFQTVMLEECKRNALQTKADAGRMSG